MQYRRIYIKGGTYFFTIVTYKRMKILHYPENIKLLKDAFNYVIKKHPFDIVAYVVMPEHIHFIMNLPEHDKDFSTRIRLLKSYFSRNCKKICYQYHSESRKNKKEKTIWQRRFWDHLIRDEADYQKHVEYIHYNPVKHGLTNSPIEWKYSSFSHYVRDGIYDKNWGSDKRLCFDKTIGME